MLANWDMQVLPVVVTKRLLLDLICQKRFRVQENGDVRLEELGGEKQSE